MTMSELYFDEYCGHETRSESHIKILNVHIVTLRGALSRKCYKLHANIHASQVTNKKR
jgi:hypothetical protein